MKILISFLLFLSLSFGEEVIKPECKEFHKDYKFYLDKADNLEDPLHDRWRKLALKSSKIFIECQAPVIVPNSDRPFEFKQKSLQQKYYAPNPFNAK